jgi:hypothetical protein
MDYINSLYIKMKIGIKNYEFNNIGRKVSYSLLYEIESREFDINKHKVIADKFYGLTFVADAPLRG